MNPSSSGNDREFDPGATGPIDTSGAVDPSATGPFDPHGHSLEQPGARIGPYTLVKILGEGGMGAVWLAEQHAPVRRQVALKVVKTGMDSESVIARFEAERQALAMMDHPNIAKVFDGGTTTAGRPYFVMELVQGIPITTYCDREKLTIRQRFELMVPVCQAVQHAHQKGIIHRDLKPSNILIGHYDSRPAPKVIDFGVAKAAGPTLNDQTMHTLAGSIVGTLEYMAPEQAEATNDDIDTRADIYSLGVVLYELLTGSPPFSRRVLQAKALEEMLRIIREVEPSKPSTKLSTADELPSLAAIRGMEPKRLTKFVRGDLDWIVMKCLEKDRGRRYETANELAMDIQRYLADEAVSAGPPGASYRLRKLIRRNKGAVLAAAAVCLAVVAGIAAVVAVQANANAKLRIANTSLDQQRQRAEDRETRAVDAVKKFRDAVADNPVLKNSPALEGLRKTLLKEPLAFFRSLRDRLQADRDTHPESLAQLGAASIDLGALTQEIGDQQSAIAAFREALAIYGALSDADPAVDEYQTQLGVANRSLGWLLSKTGKPSEARQAYEQMLALASKLAIAHPGVTEYQNDVASGHAYLGHLFYQIGQPAEARRELGAAIAIQQKLADAHPEIASHQSDLSNNRGALGVILTETGHPAEARKELDEALAIQLKLAKANPADAAIQSRLAVIHQNIARLSTDTGNLADALQAHRAALTIQRKLVDENPTSTEDLKFLAGTQNNIAVVYYNLGQMAEARKAWEAATRIEQQLVDANPTVNEFQFRLATTHGNLGELARLSDRPADARNAWESVRAIAQKLVDANPTESQFQSLLGTAHLALGILLSTSAQPVGARKELDGAVAVLRKLVAANSGVPIYRSRLMLTYNSLGVLQRSLGQMDEATKSFDEARAIGQKLADANPTIPKFQSDLATYLYNLGLASSETGRASEARKRYGEAIAILQKLVDAKSADPLSISLLARAQNDLGVLLRQNGEPGDAKKAFEAARAICEIPKQADGHVAAFERERAKSRYNLGILLRDAGQPVEARKAFVEALESREKLARHETALADEYASELAETLNDLARLDLSEQHFDAARDRLQQATNWQKKALAAYPTNPRYRKLLAAHLANLVRACQGRKDAVGAAAAQRELDELNASKP